MVERKLDQVSVELSKACDLAAYTSSRLHDVSISDTLRNRFAGACFSVALDHFDAVLMLLGYTPKLYSSAYALIRPIFESYIRGMWFLYCATDEAIENFNKNKPYQLPKKIESLIEAVEQAGRFEKQLSNSYTNNWSDLCDYAHTGLLQIQRWNTSQAIEPNYPENEILEIIRFTSALAILSAVSFAESIVGNNDLTQEFHDKAKEISA